MSAACHAKKNTLPRIPGEWKTSGRPKGEKADNLSPHFCGEYDACSLHSGESWGEERESGAFSSRSGAFFFSSSPLSPVGCAFRSLSRPCVYALSEFSDFCLHRSTLSFQFVDFQCVVGEDFTFRCFCSIALRIKVLGVNTRFSLCVHRNIAVRKSNEENIAANFRSEMRVKER